MSFTPEQIEHLNEFGRRFGEAINEALTRVRSCAGAGARELDAQLAALQVAKLQGYAVDERIADTLIAMLKDAFVRGAIDIDHLEDVTMAVLRGEPVAILQAGERVIRRERVTA